MKKKDEPDSNSMSFSWQSFSKMGRDSQIEWLNEMLKYMDLISVSEAAKMRDVTTTAIHNLIKRGRLRSQTIAGEVFVFKSEIENFERGKPGRQRKEED